MQKREVQLFLNSVDVLFPTRYHSRWTRRIRETTGLTREDAAIIALASFGSNQLGNILGVHYVLTYDQGLINGYRDHLTLLNRRLRAMTVQLRPPYHKEPSASQGRFFGFLLACLAVEATARDPV